MYRSEIVCTWNKSKTSTCVLKFIEAIESFQLLFFFYWHENKVKTYVYSSRVSSVVFTIFTVWSLLPSEFLEILQLLKVFHHLK